MTAQEAAETAARTVAEAEFAITQAEEAAKEADRAEAEAEAEAAQIYAKSAMKALNFRISSGENSITERQQASPYIRLKSKKQANIIQGEVTDSPQESCLHCIEHTTNY